VEYAVWSFAEAHAAGNPTVDHCRPDLARVVVNTHRTFAIGAPSISG
jgi:hypothetical protein